MNIFPSTDIDAQSPKECLSRDPVLSHGRGLFDENLLDLIDSVNTWVSRDQMTTASRISFKVPMSAFKATAGVFLT